MFVPDTPQSNMEFYSCPAGYCRCSYDKSVDNTTCIYSYSHSDPDLQCVCGRKGENSKNTVGDIPLVLITL